MKYPGMNPYTGAAPAGPPPGSLTVITGGILAAPLSDRPRFDYIEERMNALCAELNSERSRLVAIGDRLGAPTQPENSQTGSAATESSNVAGRLELSLDFAHSVAYDIRRAADRLERL
jgi:hypothetical protein